ncbi:hypothetical protein C0J52_01486 [Blattella germanica]|nr:hypothetical protein C0J52_01486 [Blattella germanica]
MAGSCSATLPRNRNSHRNCYSATAHPNTANCTALAPLYRPPCGIGKTGLAEAANQEQCLTKERTGNNMSLHHTLLSISTYIQN